MRLSGLAEAIARRLQDLPEERLRQLERDIADGKVGETIGKAVSEGLETGARSLLAYAKDNMHERLVEEREKRTLFESRLFSRWKAGFDLFEIFWVIALEAGISLTEKHGEQARREQDFVFDVLSRIHARACLTASEVYALMRTGHASAAMARWRTLHELAVVAIFIRENGQDTAERYLLHNAIESWKATSLYQRYCQRMGYKPIEQAEVDATRAERDQLCARYGAIYGKSYGWAAAALGITNSKGRITFDDIERASGIDHLRPFYKMASHGIHSESKGAYWNIGTIGSSIILAGPTDTGFCDPAHATLISLHQCTVCFLMTKFDVTEAMTMKMMGSLLDEAGQTFLDIQKQLEREEQGRTSQMTKEDPHA